MTTDDSHVFDVIAQALDAWSRDDIEEAERSFKAAIALYRKTGEGLDFALGRYAAWLLDQGRLDDTISVLDEAIRMNSDLPAIWADYLSILATRHDVVAMIETFDRLPPSIAQTAKLVNWLLPHVGSSVRSGDLEFAELLCRTIRDEARKRRDWDGAWIATGEHGEVLERMGRIDEAMTEWQVAFDVGSNDARTANRLSLTLDRAKRYEEAASVIRKALDRELPAATEETLRKRLARLEHRAHPGSPKRDVPSFSVRVGEGYARLVMQQRFTPPIRDLVVVDETAYCLGYAKDVGVLTRVNLSTGVAAPRNEVPALNSFQVSHGGWGIGIRRSGRVGEGTSFLAFLDPECHVCATAELPDSISEVSQGRNRWYVGCRNGRLYTFGLTGELLWEWVTPGADPAPDNPYFRPCPYFVAATEELVVISTMGDIYAIALDGALQWHLKVPNRGPLTMTMPIRGPLSNPEAWNALGVRPGASDEEVRHAYRILALATHPDRHPEDSASSERFCIIQSAYETILASAHTSGVQGSITFRIDTLTLVSTLVAVGDTILVGSSDGVLSMLDSKGEVRGRRILGRSGMKLAVDSKGVLVAAFCDGALSFFDGTSIVNAAEVEQFPTSLTPWREDILCVHGATARAFNRTGRSVWSIDFAKRISGLSVNDRYLICGAGALVVFERA